MVDVEKYWREKAAAAKAASRAVAKVPGDVRNRVLRYVAKLLLEETASLLEANEEDVNAAPGFGLSGAQIDRLRLTPTRIEDMAVAIEEIAAMPDPIGRVLSGEIRPNGLEIRKVSVPLGVVFFVYESRPNVTTDAAALCFKSGNAVILRGGKESRHSNLAIAELLRRALSEYGVPSEAMTVVDLPDRQVVGEFLKLNEFIDVAIPRGGEGLIRRVAQDATMPVIKHYKGICHVYVDKAADLTKAAAIVENAKCQRPSVCNAAETLLVDRAIAKEALAAIAPALVARQVELRGCPETCRLVREAKAASQEDYDTEHLDLVMSVRVVDGLTGAIDHITKHGSGHTDAIITEDLSAARQFQAEVDSSAVMVNASTRFNDGGQFGLGAEIGISTDKFHARGPCGLAELTSYKYLVTGDGQIRT